MIALSALSFAIPLAWSSGLPDPLVPLTTPTGRDRRAPPRPPPSGTLGPLGPLRTRGPSDTHLDEFSNTLRQAHKKYGDSAIAATPAPDVVVRKYVGGVRIRTDYSVSDIARSTGDSLRRPFQSAVESVLDLTQALQDAPVAPGTQKMLRMTAVSADFATGLSPRVQVTRVVGLVIEMGADSIDNRHADITKGRDALQLTDPRMLAGGGGKTGRAVRSGNPGKPTKPGAPGKPAGPPRPASSKDGDQRAAAPLPRPVPAARKPPAHSVDRPGSYSEPNSVPPAPEPIPSRPLADSLADYAMALPHDAVAPNSNGIIKSAQGKFIELGGRHFPVRRDTGNRTWRICRPHQPEWAGLPVRRHRKTSAWVIRRSVGLRGGGIWKKIHDAARRRRDHTLSGERLEVAAGGVMRARGNEILSTSGLTECTTLVVLNDLNLASGIYESRTMMHVLGSNLETWVVGTLDGAQALNARASQTLMRLTEQARAGRSRLIVAFGSNTSRPVSMRMTVNQEIRGRMPIRELIERIGASAVEFYRDGSSCDVSARGEFLRPADANPGRQVDADIVLDDD